MPRAAAPSTRSAVVTGGAGGIGRATARALVERGYAVVVADLDADAAKRTADEIGAAEGIGQDVTDERSHTEVADVARGHRPLGVWVNNAGVGFDGDVTETSSERIRALVDVNLLGVVWGSRAAVEAYRDQARGGFRGGTIVDIASLSGHGPVPGLSVYAATKAAVVSVAESMAAELRGERIGVHAICPDGVDTPLVTGMDPSGRGSALLHSGPRLLRPEDVAAAVVSVIGTRRIVKTLPPWRGAVMRFMRDWPTVAFALEPAVRAQGRLMARRQH